MRTMNENAEEGSRVVECLEWRAWYEEYLLHVSGRVSCNSGDIKLNLEPARLSMEPTTGLGDLDPKLLILQLTFSGGLVTDDVVELDVEWTGSPERMAAVERVEIRGACQAQIEIGS
jgi:hypothetical protein